MTAGSLREARQQSRSHKSQLNKLTRMPLILKEQPGKKIPINIIFLLFKASVFCNSLIYRWVNIVFVITTFCTTASRDGLRLKTEGAAIQMNSFRSFLPTFNNIDIFGWRDRLHVAWL